MRGSIGAGGIDRVGDILNGVESSIGSNTVLTSDISFTVIGNSGSAEYSFGEGQELGTVAKTINDDNDSTGVAAQLIFDNSVSGVAQTTATSLSDVCHQSGQIAAYELDKDLNRILIMKLQMSL